MTSIFSTTRALVKSPAPVAPAATTATTTTNATTTTPSPAATTAVDGDDFIAASTSMRDVQSGLLNGASSSGAVRARSAQDWPRAVRFGETTVGTLAPFKIESGAAVHDVSGAASNGKVTVLVDDGGTSGVYNKLRVLDASGGVRELPLQHSHKDLEDVTALADGSFVLTGSLSGADADAYRTTRVTLDAAGASIQSEQSVDLRDDVLGALAKRFGDDFVERVKKTDAKEGGLNIEGIAAVPSSSQPSSSSQGFVYGLRSPLVDKPGVDKTGARLDKGDALLAVVDAPFSGAPSTDLVQLDLAGHGVRGMEYIPALKAFVIIGGPVEKGDGYSLWMWRGGKTDPATPLKIEGFDGLRRPEAVFELAEGDRKFLVVMSEQSGPACEGAAYNFIKVEMTRGLANPDAAADARTVLMP